MRRLRRQEITRDVTHPSIGGVVRCSVAQHLSVAPSAIRLRDRLGPDLGLRPLDLVLIAAQIEDTEGVEFSGEALANVRTVKDLIELLFDLLSARDDHRPPACPELATFP